MITQKKMIIPIFGYRLTVVIYDKWDEVKHLDYNTKDEKSAPSGFTTYKDGAALVAINSKRGSTIVHEAEHVKNLIWDYIGYTPIATNDEVDAYLLTYIYEKITDVFYKHKKYETT
jgi:hypothetical protein